MSNNYLRNITLAFGFILISLYSSFGQNPVLDSLLMVLKKQNAQSEEPSLKDTARVNTLNLICQQYIYSRDFSTAMKYARIAQNTSERLIKTNADNRSKFYLANSLKLIGQIYTHRDDFNNALEQYKRELVLREETGNKTEAALCLNTIGVLYNNLDDLSQSIEYFFKALKTIEESGDQSKITLIYNSLGVAYSRQRNNTKALEYYKMELKFGEKLNDKDAIATAHINMGTIFAEEGEYDKALSEFNNFLQMAKESNEPYNIGLSWLNMGDIYFRMGDHPKALEANDKAMKIFEQLGGKLEVGIIYFNKGNTYLSMAKTNSHNKKINLLNAKTNLDQALSLFEKGGHTENMSVCYTALSSLDSCLGNYKGALEFYKKHVRYRDNVFSEDANSKSIKAELNYEFNKREAVRKVEQEKKDALATAAKENLKLILIAVLSVLLIVFLSAGLIYRSLRITRKQKKLVEIQKQIIQGKNKDILDSINYAQRIQKSLLTSEKYINRNINKLKETVHITTK